MHVMSETDSCSLCESGELSYTIPFCCKQFPPHQVCLELCIDSGGVLLSSVMQWHVRGKIGLVTCCSTPIKDSSSPSCTFSFSNSSTIWVSLSNLSSWSLNSPFSISPSNVITIVFGLSCFSGASGDSEHTFFKVCKYYNKQVPGSGGPTTAKSSWTLTPSFDTHHSIASATALNIFSGWSEPKWQHGINKDAIIPLHPEPLAITGISRYQGALP